MSKTSMNSYDMHGMELEVGELAYKESGSNTVTQITNRSTGVTLNKVAGQITMDNTSLAAGAEATFTVTNSHVSAKSVVVVNAASGQTADTSVAVVSAVAAGSFDITITNLHASTADTGAMVINFIVIDVI
jgi:glucosamine 6-phosphate synthetase-like amidotransferase/phosphosugar isomerase protein